MTSTLVKFAGPVVVGGGVAIVAAVQLDLGIGPVYLFGVLLVVLGVAGQMARVRRQRPTGEHPAVQVGVPVQGRWRGLNSPATKVPSHTHGYAQTFAIDITYEPEGASPRRMDWLWPIMRRPSAFPSYGQPVLAPFDGVVIRAWGSHRDHLTRLSPVGILYLLLEGLVRSLGRPQHLLGNHVFVRAGDGVVAVVAHLRRGSVRVAPGDRVVAGEVLAECGNSGNSSDPHVHFQLMDGPDIETARGLPFAWLFSDDGGGERRGVPADDELFVADPADVGTSSTRNPVRKPQLSEPGGVGPAGRWQ